MKFTSTLKLKLIYVFRINDDSHSGCLKVGEATSDNGDIWGLEPNSKALNKAAKNRINQYTQTAGIAYDLLYTEVTIYTVKGEIRSFNDKEVHNVLLRSGIEKKVFDTENKANEWFITDLETVKKAITAVKQGKESLNASQITTNQSPIVFRPEQKDAIQKTKNQFKKSNEMLWFAKMRFGKTLSALQVVREHNFKRTLILTHRPVVDAGWFEDFNKIFYDKPNFNYGSKSKGDTFLSLEKRCNKEDVQYIYFASMQDLRGSELVGGNFDKNNEIFNTPWDFLIVDEAHEGTQTELGKNVISELRRTKTKILHLSGTPFNLIDDYKEEEIYTWDYVMEQKAKKEWDDIHFGDPNPYASLPRMNIFTYDLGKLINDFVDEDVAFNFKEFFRVDKTNEFIHKNDVIAFLDLISKGDNESNYPFATEEYRNNFRHSLWMVPGVKEARALSLLLKSHTVFKHFNIVNVAGDGDEEEANEEALQKLNKAITNKPQETYTITLSCGRLTTGVSVKAWTAVFMLSGSYNTSASNYMQTIFRVQTPAIINGKVKEECFVFDFAPDRTLKVIAEAAKMSAKAGKTTDEDRKIMGEFLNFCPIISADGSKMKEYNVNSMLEQLKKVYVERVVRNGFEDTHLYDNDQLMKLGSVDLEEFMGLKKIIGSTKAMPKNSDIDINNQGFTDEEFEKLEATKKKKKQDLSEDEKKILEEREIKKKNRDTAVSILRGISIRMPLIIYGADIKDEENELTIDNFTDLVDSKSWNEFMPKGVTKSTFKKFKRYYEPDVFRAAGKRIRAVARATDNLPIDQRIERITAIFGRFKNPDKETILTPWRVVNMHMSDCLGGYVFFDGKFENPISIPRYVNRENITENVYSKDSYLLEINSKSGLYPLYLTYSLYRKSIDIQYSKKEYDELTILQQQRIWEEVVAKNIFVVCKTPMAKSITKRTLVGFREVTVNTRYFEDLENQITHKQSKFLKKVIKGNSYWKANKNENMKFNAIVGNPPYQLMDGGAQASARPIYNNFVQIAMSLSPKYVSMIMPARWYSGGRDLNDFRAAMLKDKSISILHDFLNPEQIFPNTNIRGGLCYFLWDKDYDNSKKLTQVITHYKNGEIITAKRKLKSEEIDTFIRHNEAVNIIAKIKGNRQFQSFADLVSPLRPFGLRGYFTKNDKFRSTKDGLNDIVTCYGKGMTIGYMERDEVPNRKEWIDSYKVFTSRANNIGTELNDDNLNTFIGLPGSICTESYIAIGSQSKLTKQSAKNLCKYMTTKFVRFLHSIAKSSQDATSKTYKFIPIQDFTNKSDINWNKSINEIEKELYNKYSLSKAQIGFIDKMIKEM